jgi:hypothetical protein
MSLMGYIPSSAGNNETRRVSRKKETAPRQVFFTDEPHKKFSDDSRHRE